MLQSMATQAKNIIKTKGDDKMSISPATAHFRQTKYQLVCTPEVIPSGSRLFEQVYSLLRLDIEDDTVETCFLYDVSRNASTASAILNEVISCQPAAEDFREFVAELL